MLALILVAALSAQAIDGFAVHAPPAIVIAWLKTNRDMLVRCGGVQVVKHEGTLLTVRRNGIDIQLRESADVHKDSATYSVRLLWASRKLRSWNTDVTIQPAGDGTWTWVSISLRATVYGLGERAVQQELSDSLDRVKSYLRRVFQ